MADIKRDIYGIGKQMRKRASGWGAMLPSISNLVNAGGELTAIGAAYVVAAAVAGGTAAGALASWATAKGKQDYSTAKKSYENEALVADRDYLKSKIRQEGEALKSQGAARPMRMLR